MSPQINWEDDMCTDVVRSTCEEIGISVAITLGSALVTWALTVTRGRAIGMFNDGGTTSTAFAATEGVWVARAMM